MWSTLVKWKKLDEKEYKKTMVELTLFISLPSIVTGFIMGMF